MTPSVSVVMPTLNERQFVLDAVCSLLDQDYENLLEILIVDGGSTDGTSDIVDRFGPPVRRVVNPAVTAAAGLNRGLAEAKGEIVVRADAHSLYATDYVRRCVSGLCDPGVWNVGGPMRAVGTTTFGRAVAAVTSSPLGIGPGRFHYSTLRETVDTVYLGAFRRSTLEMLGGWDESQLQWGAEDHELNLRLRDAGGTILLDPAVRSTYFVRETPTALRRQYFNYGLGKASTLRKHRRLPALRPLVPAVFVAASVGGLVLGRGWARIALPAVHGGFVAWAAARIARRAEVAPLRAFVALEICHWSYGAGFLGGVGRIVRGRSFDSRPTGHR